MKSGVPLPRLLGTVMFECMSIGGFIVNLSNILLGVASIRYFLVSIGFLNASSLTVIVILSKTGENSPLML